MALQKHSVKIERSGSQTIQLEWGASKPNDL